MTSARARRSMLPGYSSQIGAAQSSPALSLETSPVQYTEVAVPQSSNLAFDPRGLVTLSWDASHTATLPEQPAPLVNETPPIPFGAPPAYVRSLKPQSDVIYTFSPGTRDTMLLVPPPESPDTRPKFHISIGMNPFTPFSYITTVRQGGTENGKLVGEFEMSGMLNEVHMEWVTFDRIRQKALSHVLSVCSTHADGVGLLDRPNERPRRWKYNNLTLYWVFDGDNKTKRCYTTSELRLPHVKKDKAVAKFIPRRINNGRELEREKLEVTPQGHEFLDQILISLLILERRRLTPSQDNRAPTRNYV